MDITDEQIERAIRIRYKNWRGETGDRHITPNHIWWGSTEWHSEPQWLLSAFDHDKQAGRDFALLDISLAAAAIPAAPLSLLRRVRASLQTELDRGVITDTLWMNDVMSETIFDALDAALSDTGGAAAPAAECNHEGWSYELHGRGCIKCGAMLVDAGD